MRSTRWILFFSFILLLLNPNIAGAKSFSIEKVDIHAYLLDNGDLYVEEFFIYQFNGTYNGTTRTIGDDKHEGVQFFEGYLSPNIRELALLDTATLKPLKVEREDLTFKIFSPAANEKKTVVYRYYIKGAVSKYEDTGQFYWRFFDDLNESDLHDVKIKINLNNDSTSMLRGRAFLHDLTGGTLMKSRQGEIVYQNDFLPAYKTVEIRYLFPAVFLKNASYTEKAPMLPTFLEEEKNYQQRLEIRNRWIPIVENITLGMTLFLLLLTIFYPQRISRLFYKRLAISDLEKVDSFILANLYRKGQLQYSDLLSALYKLHQNGDLSIDRVATRKTFLSDNELPSFTYRFTLLKEITSLAEYERELINWLFTKDENANLSFSLDQLILPSETEKAKNWKLEKDYKRIEKEFERHFKKWKKSVHLDQDIRRYVRKNIVRDWLQKLGIPIWIGLSLIYSIMGMSDGYSIGLIAFNLLFGFVIMLYKNKKQHAFPTYLVFGTFITYMFNNDLSDSYSFLCIAFIITAIFQPFYYMTSNGRAYFKAMKAFRKEVCSGQFDFLKGNVLNEKWLQHALSIDLFVEIEYKYWNHFSSKVDELSHVFILDDEEPIFGYYYILSRQLERMLRDGNSSGSSTSRGSSSGGGGGAGAF